ncbi:cobyrinic acid a,c-diamide synthase [Thermocladium modestius]|uniref:Cobyrinate a,c-diamide synthase n=1 Tax=Thermocladium modestius TaxID=62609 RepID=A0A830GTY2_9CREN|nr:cobyrinate a,c-diamide synthase [Thermocladium modestius]GGP19388.1 cobyrinic acid a,c-diamide synthase [Thermocladium modestius]
MHFPRAVVAGVSSGVGKTMVSTGIMAALSKKYVVQPFKVGPDFIDITFHKSATGRPSINLDVWLMGSDGVISSFVRSAPAAGISIIEGVMGLFDGELSGNSTMGVARLLSAPVILVLDCSAMGETAGAVVRGFRDVIRGVILNNTSSKSHCDMCRWGVEQLAGVKVLGCVPRDPAVTVPERHLGLRMAHEVPPGFIKGLAKLVEDNVDLDELVRIAYESPEINAAPDGADRVTITDSAAYIAFDSAFNFYYQENIDALERAGFRVRFFSPTAGDVYGSDAGLVIFGGGYPELFLDELAGNQALMNALRRDSAAGLPIYAECGGLMYLSKYIDNGGKRVNMVGLFDVGIEMGRRLTLGYTVLEATRDSLIAARGGELRGHEFHYSSPLLLGPAEFAYVVRRGKGIDGFDGLISHNTLAQYSHLILARSGSIDRLANISNSYNRK